MKNIWNRFVAFSTKKKVWTCVIAFVIILAIVSAITFPILLEYKQGEHAETMWTETTVFSTDYAAKTLYKEAGKDFVILNFTDTQITFSASFGKTSLVYKTMKKAIEEAKPDLITFSGDLAWGLFTRQCYEKIVDIMDGFEIPWTFAYGNHDHQGNADLNYLGEIVQKSEYGIFDKGFRNVMGTGNFFINVVEKQPDGREKIVHTVFMMDSGDSGYRFDEEEKTYDYDYLTKEDIRQVEVSFNELQQTNKGLLGDCTMDFSAYPFLEDIDEEKNRVQIGTGYSAIDYSQIEWYTWVLNGNKTINANNGFVDAMPESTCIFHIPFNEYYDAYKQWLEAIRDKDIATLTAMDAEGRMRMNETPGSCSVNTGFFDRMVALGSTKNVICGHDHINDFSIVYKGIRLTYGVKTGKECYWVDDGSMNGGTVVTIRDAGTETKQLYIAK